MRSSRLAFNLRFPGQYFDAETGKHYNYYRDYDASVGRYIQSDPIGLAGGINTFSYVSSDPLAAADFYGLASPSRGGYVTCSPGSNSQLVPEVIRLDPKKEKCGIRECMIQHEQKHIEDLNRMSRSICRFARPGAPIRGTSQMEVGAYDVELICLGGKLGGAGCECDKIIQNRINEVTGYRNAAAGGR